MNALTICRGVARSRNPTDRRTCGGGLQGRIIALFALAVMAIRHRVDRRSPKCLLGQPSVDGQRIWSALLGETLTRKRDPRNRVRRLLRRLRLYSFVTDPLGDPRTQTWLIKASRRSQMLPLGHNRMKSRIRIFSIHDRMDAVAAAMPGQSCCRLCFALHPDISLTLRNRSIQREL